MSSPPEMEGAALLQKSPGKPVSVREARNLMATRWEVLALGEEPSRVRAAAEAILDEIERLENLLSRYRHQSDVSAINAAGAGEIVRLEPGLFALLEMAQNISAATGGAFDVTMGPLIAAWGFAGSSGHPASPSEVEQAAGRCGYENLELDEGENGIRKQQEGVEIDLGAIGKGYAIDSAIDEMEPGALSAALIHAGSSTVYGYNAPPGEPGWRVGVVDPHHPEDQPLAGVLLANMALSVSAPHGRSFRHEGRRYGHVLDPRTGYPVEGAVLAAVVHPSAALTDALSTALLVLGEEGPQMMDRLFPEAGYLILGADPAAAPRVGGPPALRPQLRSSLA